MKKRIQSLTIAIIMLCSLFINVYAESYSTIEIKLTLGEKIIYINGLPTEIDAPPVARNNRTMVPIRVIAEALGAEVEWTTWMLKDAVSIKPKDTFYSYYVVVGESNVIVWKDAFHEKFDPDLEIKDTIDSPAFVENNRTYLPLRFVAEGLGATVEWDGKTQSITIIK